MLEITACSTCLFWESEHSLFASAALYLLPLPPFPSLLSSSLRHPPLSLLHGCTLVSCRATLSRILFGARYDTSVIGNGDESGGKKFVVPRFVVFDGGTEARSNRSGSVWQNSRDEYIHICIYIYSGNRTKVELIN